MDIETEKVVELLFPNGAPDSWKESPEFYQYLSKLGGFDLEQLNKEPDHLTDEKNMVVHQTQELAFTNYKTFIRTAESSRVIFHQFNETEERLDRLVQKIPAFMDKCQSFCETSKEINAHWRLNSLTLTKNAELLEILEMPQLMETCLRSNQYNEALELSQYARQLGTKHADIPIILSIVAEIENSWSGMVRQVIGSLRGDLPLPRCLQLVGLLRSMEAFTEPELRIKFLQTRDSWLQGLLNAIPKDDPNIHLTKTIELSRIHLFNIITQYRALFNDDGHLSMSRDFAINESAIFYHWLEEKISQFLRTLEHDLPNVTSIDSILGQCTYFGLSFGRVGADFTGRMSDIFVRVIRDKFDTNVYRATRKFEKDMETFTLINKLQRTDVKTHTLVKSENPPEQLVEFYPLAEYCNGLIHVFNEFRLCAPIALADPCTRRLQSSLIMVAKAMLVFYKQEQQAFTAAERENMVKFAESLSEHLVPYVQYCLQAIFPPNEVATHLGISVGELQKEGITFLDEKVILEPLAQLLPVRSITKDSLLLKLPTIEKDQSKVTQANETIVKIESDTTERVQSTPIVEEVIFTESKDLVKEDVMTASESLTETMASQVQELTGDSTNIDTSSIMNN
ncbi:conserved oligomeric Golgi complex subunit 8 [Orussus abietinus]|uniref:conserved oligomeric Golgi complex subunit 8 n=1 Tax=Orussus abietinus TaxID=222816 RepID=UPI0006250160|nr:conserved oligomeric Golgi complex subunit 8 [Orussus abietinus]